MADKSAGASAERVRKVGVQAEVAERVGGCARAAQTKEAEIAGEDEDDGGQIIAGDSDRVNIEGSGDKRDN